MLPGTLSLEEHLSSSHEVWLSLELHCYHDPWWTPGLCQVPQLKTILKHDLRPKHLIVKRWAILLQLVPVPGTVPGMLKVPILGSQAAISICWRHQSQRDAIFKGLGYNSRNAAAVPSLSQPSLPITLRLPKIHHRRRLPCRKDKRMKTKS